MSLSRRMDVRGHRSLPNYSRHIMLLRVLWALASPLFGWSPRPLFAWRVFLLRRFGAQIGADVRIYPSAHIRMPWNLRIDELATVGEEANLYSLGMIHIGARSMVSQGAHLCAGSHDHRDPRLPLLTPPITIGRDVWICAEAFIGPGVSIGDGCVVGARSVVVKDVPAWRIVAGNPARVIGERELRDVGAKSD